MISRSFHSFPMFGHVPPTGTILKHIAAQVERKGHTKQRNMQICCECAGCSDLITQRAKKQDKTLKHFVLNIEFPLPSTNFYSMNHVSKGELQTVLPRPKSQSIPQNISTTCWLAVITHLTFIFPFGIFPVIQGQLANIRHVHLVVQTLDTYVHISYYSIQYTYKMC